MRGEVRATIPKRRAIELQKPQKGKDVGAKTRKSIPKPDPKTKGSGDKKSATLQGLKRYFIYGQQPSYPVGMFAGVPIGPWQFNNRGRMPGLSAFSRFPMMAARSPLPSPHSGWDIAAPQQGIARSIHRADEWGARAAPRYFDPVLTGSPVRVPMNPLYAQMRANEFAGEPGQPTRGKFQYGIQPGNGPPFLGFASVPIMQPVAMSDARTSQPGFPESGGMDGGFEGGQEEGGYSRGDVPSNFEQNDRPGSNVPGLVRGMTQELPGSNGPEAVPVNGAMGSVREGLGGGLEQELMEESGPNFARNMGPQEDASDDFERISDPEKYVPAPFYRPPMYNPHESEEFFPDGTNEKFRHDESEYLERKGYSSRSSGPYNEDVKSAEGNAAEIYEDEKRQEEQEQQEDEERKREHLKGTTSIDINGNKLEQGPDGRFAFTKEHVGFGPITVEAKTAKSALKDPSEEDD